MRSWFITFLLLICYASRCDLDLWPFDLERLQCVDCHVIKLCAKFQRIKQSVAELLRFKYVQFSSSSPSWIWPEVDLNDAYKIEKKTFKISCSVPKQGWFKGYWGRKSRPRFAILAPVNNKGGWARYLMKKWSSTLGWICVLHLIWSYLTSGLRSRGPVKNTAVNPTAFDIPGAVKVTKIIALIRIKICSSGNIFHLQNTEYIH